MVNVRNIAKKVVENIVKYFTEQRKGQEYTTIDLDNTTTLLKYIEETIIVKVDIVQQMIHQHMSLELLISSNGRILFQGELEGDGVIMNRIADNIYYSLQGIMEVYANDNRRNSQIESAIYYS